MVTPTGPGHPAGQPPEPIDERKLATTLKTQLSKFSEELHLIMNSPHLADSSPALETVAQAIQDLHSTAHQAAKLEI